MLVYYFFSATAAFFVAMFLFNYFLNALRDEEYKIAIFQLFLFVVDVAYYVNALSMLSRCM